MFKFAAFAVFLILIILVSIMIFVSEVLLDFFWIFFRIGRVRTVAAFIFQSRCGINVRRVSLVLSRLSLLRKVEVDVQVIDISLLIDRLEFVIANFRSIMFCSVGLQIGCGSGFCQIRFFFGIFGSMQRDFGFIFLCVSLNQVRVKVSLNVCGSLRKRREIFSNLGLKRSVRSVISIVGLRFFDGLNGFGIIFGAFIVSNWIALVGLRVCIYLYLNRFSKKQLFYWVGVWVQIIFRLEVMVFALTSLS